MLGLETAFEWMPTSRVAIQRLERLPDKWTGEALELSDFFSCGVFVGDLLCFQAQFKALPGNGFCFTEHVVAAATSATPASLRASQNAWGVVVTDTTNSTYHNEAPDFFRSDVDVYARDEVGNFLQLNLAMFMWWVVEKRSACVQNVRF